MNIRNPFNQSSDPAGRPFSAPAAIGGPAPRGSVNYPDKVTSLPAPTGSNDPKQRVMPFLAQQCILEGNAQGFKECEAARLAIEGYAANVSGLSYAAAIQIEQADRARQSWTAARDQLDRARSVLTTYVLHHGVGWLWLYALVWVLLILGDIAGGTLVLVKAGEYPEFALVLCAAVGAAAVTSAKLGDDFRRRLLWLRHHEKLPADDEAKQMVIEVFTFGDLPYRFLVRIAALIAATAGALVLGTFAIRVAVDDPFLAVGFALWAAGICGGSFVNAWAHTDPAHTAIRNYEHAEASERAKRDQSKTPAVEQRATNERAISERLLAHYGAAMALWNTKLAEAAGYLANNPQMIGHGTDGPSFLLNTEPDFKADFEVLADTYQVALTGRSGATPDSADGDNSNDQPDDVADGHDAAVIDIATKLAGIIGGEVTTADLPSPGGAGNADPHEEAQS